MSGAIDCRCAATAAAAGGRWAAGPAAVTLCRPLSLACITAARAADCAVRRPRSWPSGQP